MSDAADMVGQVSGDSDRLVRVFRDLNGDISFATLDDVCIEPHEDVRVGMLCKLANERDWPATVDFPHSIEGYEGSLSELTKSVIEKLYGII